MNRKVKTYLIKAVTLRDPDEVCGVPYKNRKLKQSICVSFDEQTGLFSNSDCLW